jgi:hypothetical protein
MLNELKRKSFQSKSNINEVDYEIPCNPKPKKQTKLSHTYFTTPNSPINKAVESNIKIVENKIYKLKVDAFDKIKKEITEAKEKRNKLIITVQFLEDQLSILNNEKMKKDSSAFNTYNIMTKSQLVSDRVKLESKYMKKEIPLLKSKIEEVYRYNIDETRDS